MHLVYDLPVELQDKILHLAWQLCLYCSATLLLDDRPFYPSYVCKEANGIAHVIFPFCSRALHHVMYTQSSRRMTSSIFDYRSMRKVIEGPIYG